MGRSSRRSSTSRARCCAAPSAASSALARTEDLGDSVVLEFVNRASDLLFAMARFADVPDPHLFEGRGKSDRRE